MTENEFDKELDRMMNEKLNEKHFEFKESYWTNAKELISNDRRKRKNGLFLATIVFFTVIGISMAIIATSPDKKISYKAPALPAASTAVNMETYEPIKISGASKKNQTGTPAATKWPVAHPEHTPATSTPSIAKPADAALPYETRQPAKRGNNVNTASLNHINAVTAKEESAPANARPTPTDSIPHTIGNSNDITNPANQHVAPPDETVFSEEENRYHPAGLGMIEPGTYRPVKVVRNLCDTCLRRKFIYPDYAGRKASKIKFLAPEAGITWFNPSSTTDNFNVSAGLRYHYFISKRIDLGIGIFYSRLHQQLDDLVYDQIKYSFRKQVNRTIIRTLTLDYLEMPLHLGLLVHKGHFITTGATFGYLINSHNAIIKQGGSENKTSTTFDNGYKYAINNYDVQLNIGYMVFLPKKIILSANYGFGLLDISENRAFHSALINRNTGVRLNIAYKLTK